MNDKRVEGREIPFLLAALITVVMLLGLVTLVAAQGRRVETARPVAAAKTAPPLLFADTNRATLSAGSVLRVAETTATPGDVIELFGNAWATSAIGLVYDPGRQQVRYAHESQSVTPSPTVFDVARASHVPSSGFALSAVNAGWPWQLDNRTGAAYDFIADTTFLPDYNGDLAYADDNIVEVSLNGAILNAWEMDDEVGSNDSSDGSAIDGIVDIAVVPGSGGAPARYFATAFYDGGVVYEIALTKTGVPWTPNSWSTVQTYTGAIASTFNDNLGIDYDSQNHVLYHSGYGSSTILVTDLDMKPITTFDCPVPGGYASGVTFIEGSWPPEIWATNYASNETARCEAVGDPPVQPDWGQWVDGEPWDPAAPVLAETGDVIRVTDVITAVQPFTLTATWNPARLGLVSWSVSPSVAQVVSGTASLQVVAPAGPPELIAIDKWFAVKPCTWSTTTLVQQLLVDGGPSFAPRAVTVAKQAPQLSLESDYAAEVEVGASVSYTLSFANDGGYENAVAIGATFPTTAPFVYAEPYPDTVGADGLTAEWNVGDLAQGDKGQIAIYLFIPETVPVSTTIPIWNGIYNHLGQLAAESEVVLHASAAVSPVSWEKLVDGEPWQPGIALTRQTADTFLVEEVIDPAGNATGFSLADNWDPEELALLAGWTVAPVQYGAYVSSGDGFWLLDVPPGVDFGPVTTGKVFRVEPSVYPSTSLWETLETGSGAARFRPVFVERELPDLWLESALEEGAFDDNLLLSYGLTYGNSGGRESGYKIRSNFAPDLTFIEAQPPPSAVGEGWIEWHFADELEKGDAGKIAVTLAVPPFWPLPEPLEIWNGILNHADEVANAGPLTVHLPAPVWERWVNGERWNPGMELVARAGEVIVVTDRITTRSTVATVEQWIPDHLQLLDLIVEPELGELTIDDDILTWVFPEGGPGEMILTRRYRLRGGAWSYTVLRDELWVAHDLWERSPLQLDREPVLYLPLVKN